MLAISFIMQTNILHRVLFSATLYICCIYYIIPMYSTIIYNTLVIEISNGGIFCKANHGNIRVDTSRTTYTQVIFVNCVGDGSGSWRLPLDRCRYGLEEQHGDQFLVGRPKALWHFFLYYYFFYINPHQDVPTPTVTLFDRQDGTTQH